MAQFYYSDEELNIVASELDSFDGRKDPERCTALVNQLRQCQDRVRFFSFWEFIHFIFCWNYNIFMILEVTFVFSTNIFLQPIEKICVIMK